MKRIKYKILMEANIGTEENPKIVQSFGDVDFPCLDENLSAEIEKIKARAYNSEYTIEDDGHPDPKETEGGSIQDKGKALAEAKILALKQRLSDTDYQAIKFSEGWFTEEEFAPMKAYRQSLRDKINELEQGGCFSELAFGPGEPPTISHSVEVVSE